MNLVLTSDFPSSAIQPVSQRILQTAASPRVAWVPPITSVGRERFHAAQQHFGQIGVSRLEFCDIDAEPDAAQLRALGEYDVVYFTGGDPFVFRRNIERSGMAAGIRDCLAAGRLVIAASGGAMQFTPNVSLYRLLSESVESAITGRDQAVALGIVPYELLPHLNRLDSAFLDRVQRYSEIVSADIVALEDGAALVHGQEDQPLCVGRAERFRGGVRTVIESMASER